MNIFDRDDAIGITSVVFLNKLCLIQMVVLLSVVGYV